MGNAIKVTVYLDRDYIQKKIFFIERGTTRSEIVEEANKMVGENGWHALDTDKI